MVCRTYSCCKMTYASFQEVLLHRPLHQIAVDRRLGDFLIVFDGLVVVLLECCQVSDLEEELICQPVSKLVSMKFFTPVGHSPLVQDEEHLTPRHCHFRTIPPLCHKPPSPSSYPQFPTHRPLLDSADASPLSESCLSTYSG